MLRAVLDYGQLGVAYVIMGFMILIGHDDQFAAWLERQGWSVTPR